jgi:hypothetical protein
MVEIDQSLSKLRQGNFDTNRPKRFPLAHEKKEGGDLGFPSSYVIRPLRLELTGPAFSAYLSTGGSGWQHRT